MREGFHRGSRGVKNNKCKWLADVQRGTFIPGTWRCHCGLLATQVLTAFIINIWSFWMNALNVICLNSFKIKFNPRKAVPGILTVILRQMLPRHTPTHWSGLLCHACHAALLATTEIEFGHQTATLPNLCSSDSVVRCRHMDSVGKWYPQAAVFSHGMPASDTGRQMAGSCEERRHSWYNWPAEHHWHSRQETSCTVRAHSQTG